MSYTLSEADIRATLVKIDDGVVLKTGDLLSHERIDRAIRAAFKGKISANGNRPCIAHEILLSRDHKHIGVVVNENAYPCTLEGCGGRRRYVRWNDGTHSFPCSKGCSHYSGGLYQIG